MTASFGLGQIVGPIFAGWVHDLTGTFLLPSVAAAALRRSAPCWVEAYRSSVAMTSATAPAMSAGSNSACASHTNQGSRESGSGSRP